MNIKKIIDSIYGQYIISILLGLGLATLFRRACNKRNCLVFKGPNIDNIKNQTFKFNNKCYTFTSEAESCSPFKKIVPFA